jgi:hypothetical protein
VLSMTPLQSWAVLLLLLAAVLLAVWLIARAEVALQRRRAAAAAPTRHVDDPARRPRLRLMEASSEPDRGLSEVYDWAEQGM